MIDAAAQIATLYEALGEPVTPAVGDPFLALFSVADVDTFDSASQAGDFELRYPATVTLAVGAVVTLRTQQYRVASDPQRIGDGRERVVRLREVTA